MRVIKFRGFHADEHGETVIKLDGKEIKGTWYKGDLSTDGGYYIKEHSVIPETVGQYTGLTDKNGTKIFEGDILGGFWDTQTQIYYDEQNCQFRAKEKGGFNRPIDYYCGYPIRFEVIGNIHDNPELMEVEE